MKLKNCVAAIAAAVSLMAGGQASAVPVGLELLLLVDVSGSVDATEYNLQKTGYVNAFSSAAVQSAILGSQGGAIAVSYAEWSGAANQVQQVGWTLIDSVASANAFATTLNAVTRSSNLNTAIQTAMSWGSGLFANGFESSRQVIDVSGDGERNEGLTGTLGRDAALAAGVDTINGIYIGAAPLSALAIYYENNVKGGVGGFAIGASTFSDFGAAIQTKLIREINTDVPEPGSIALLGAGLLALAASRRRKNQA